MGRVGLGGVGIPIPVLPLGSCVSRAGFNLCASVFKRNHRPKMASLTLKANSTS